MLSAWVLCLPPCGSDSQQRKLTGPLVPVRLACFPSIASSDWYANRPAANGKKSPLGAPWSAKWAALRPVNQVKKVDMTEGSDEVGGKSGSHVPPLLTCRGLVPVESVGL